jgi:hypothetical protein
VLNAAQTVELGELNITYRILIPIGGIMRPYLYVEFPASDDKQDWFGIAHDECNWDSLETCGYLGERELFIRNGLYCEECGYGLEDTVNLPM